MASSYPNSIDSAATLYSPVDAFSTKPLETTTTGQVLAGDTIISVQSTSGGFADAYGILSIDDELIVYTGKNAAQFTGCQRGAFGTQAAQHAQGAIVRANMVSGFITALQSAVLAIENELGTVLARNYVRANGDQTVTGVKTFQDGANFGSGAKAATGLIRLPNTGAMKWRKADNSGDLGMALNANDHIAFDAIIAFAPGQTFGSFSYPDATTNSKGIVQIDAVGGIAVNVGVISLASSGVTPGTHTKVTVDAKGRVMAGASLAASDLPAHTHVAGDIASGAFGVPRGGTGLTSCALGDVLYGSGPSTMATLPGNASASRKFLRQTGTGTDSAPPAWDTIAAADLPSSAAVEFAKLGLNVAPSSHVLDVQGANSDTVISRFGYDSSGFKSLVEVRTKQTLTGSGNEAGRGCLRILDTVAAPNRSMEIGYYQYGAAIITQNLFEFWTTGLSVRDFNGSAEPFLAVRDRLDTSDIRLRHDGTKGIIEITGAGTGGIRIGGVGPLTLSSSYGTVLTLANDGTGTFASHLYANGNIIAQGSAGGFRFNARGGSGDYQWYAEWGKAFLYDHASAANRIVVSSGNVGIDEASPEYKLDVNGPFRSRGTLRVGGDQAFIECGPYQTVGSDLENMLKRSEDFSTVWSPDGGSCSVAANTADALAPDGNQTADRLTSSGDSAKIQQQIAGLTDGGTYTFYVWAKVASGTRKISLAIVDNAYASYLAGPSQVTLTTSWQRFKITGTLATGQSGLWVVVRNFTGNGDEWTNGTVIYLWGACLQEGNDPKRAYVRTWDSQVPRNRTGAALGATLVTAINDTEPPLTIYGSGSNLVDKTLLQVTSGGELIIAGGSGDGYRLAELMSASNPNGWAGVLKVKTPAGTTLGYILLYTSP